MLLFFLQHHVGNSVFDIPTRGICWNWNWYLLAPYIFANMLIFAAYFAIPIQFFLIAKERRGKWLTKEIMIYGLFILLCGAGHLVQVALVWFGIYPFAVAWDFMTGAVSIMAAALTLRHIKTVQGLPDKQEMQELKDEISEELSKSADESQSEQIRQLLERSRALIEKVETLPTG